MRGIKMGGNTYKVTVTFRHTEPTAALKTYASEKLAHVLEKYHVEQSAEIEVILSVEKRDHVVEVNSRSMGFDVHLKAITEDLYSAIDKAVDTLESQLRKQKDRAVTQKHQ